MTITVREVKPPTPPRREPPRRREGHGPEEVWTPPGAMSIGTWLLIGAIAMFFTALTSALLVRRASGDWAAIPAPPLLWLSTVAIVASSLALERGRAALSAGDTVTFHRRLRWAVGFGLAFVVGQLVTWQTLVAGSVYITTNPHSSYFYLLTGSHIVHMLGGFGGMALVATRVVHRDRRSPQAAGVLATYWHFLAGLWLYLFAVLFWI